MLCSQIELVLEIIRHFIQSRVYDPGGGLVGIGVFFLLCIRVRCLVLVRVGEDQLLVQSRLVLVISESTVVVHLPENIFLPLFVLFFAGIDPFSGGIIFISGKGVQCFRTFRNCCQTSRFCYVQIFGTFSEIFLCGMFDSVGGAAETDVVHVGFQNLIFGVGTFQFHGTENFTDLTGRGLLAVTGDIFDQLLRNGRTTLIGIIDVYEHVDKGRNGTLIVHAVMGIETFIFCTDKSIPRMLRNLVDVNGNTLGFVGDLIDVHPFAAAVLSIDVGIVGKFHFFNGNIGHIVPKVHDIDDQCRCHNGAGDDQNHEHRRKCGTQNRKRLPQNENPFGLGSGFFQFRTVIGIFRCTGRSVIFPHRNACPAFFGSLSVVSGGRTVSSFVVIHSIDSFQKPAVRQNTHRGICCCFAGAVPHKISLYVRRIGSIARDAHCRNVYHIIIAHFTGNVKRYGGFSLKNMQIV